MAYRSVAAMQTSLRGSRASCTRPSFRRAVRCTAVMPREEAAKDKKGEIDMMSLPAVHGLPIIGMAKYLSDNDLDLSKLHKEHGDAFVINFGIVMGGWNLAVCDEKACKEILASNHTRFISSWPDEFVRLLSPWRRTAEPDEQNEWKKILLRVLSKDNVMNLQLPLLVEDITARLRNQAASGEQVLWTQFGRRIAFGVASRTSMGALLTDKVIDELFKEFSEISVDKMMSFGLRDGVPGTSFHRSVKARNRMEAMLYSMIVPALEDPALLEGETSGVARMVRAVHEEDAQFIPRDSESLARYIASQTFFLMFAGTDTTTQALLNMAILCHRHPQWFRKLQQEQDRLRAEFGDTLDRKVLSRSAVATAFAQEILRLTTPVPSAFRTAASDTTVQGIRIPKGTGVIANLQTPTLRTGTPEFDPAQWLNADETQAAANDANGNLVWGGGPRRCAGQNLATAETMACLALLAREVDGFVIPPEKNDHQYVAGPAHPTGCPVTLIPRSL